MRLNWVFARRVQREFITGRSELILGLEEFRMEFEEMNLEGLQRSEA